MSTILITITCSIVVSAAVGFVAYWIGVRAQSRDTRRWAVRALTAERVTAILYGSIMEMNSAVKSFMDGETPLTDDERARFERLLDEAGA